MRILLTVSLVLFSLILGAQQGGEKTTPAEKEKKEELPPVDKKGAPPVRIGQVISDSPMARSYPSALRSLLALADNETSIKVDGDPRIFKNFEKPGLNL